MVSETKAAVNPGPGQDLKTRESGMHAWCTHGIVL